MKAKDIPAAYRVSGRGVERQEEDVALTEGLGDSCLGLC